MLLEAIGYQATAATVAGSAATAFTNDSLTVKNGRGDVAAFLIGWIIKNQTLGFQQLIWPSGHDTTRGMRAVSLTSCVASAMSIGSHAPLMAQELISATIGATAVAGDIEQGIMLLFYPDLPGQDARLITSEELDRRSRRLLTVAAQIAPGTAGNWGGSEAINTDSDLLRANTDYAILGGLSEADITAIGISGPDFGNARVAIPGATNEPSLTNRWFYMLSFWTGLPCIPVFNSANKGATNLVLADDENGAATDFSLNLAELLPA